MFVNRYENGQIRELFACEQYEGQEYLENAEITKTKEQLLSELEADFQAKLAQVQIVQAIETDGLTRAYPVNCTDDSITNLIKILNGAINGVCYALLTDMATMKKRDCYFTVEEFTEKFKQPAELRVRQLLSEKGQAINALEA